MQERLPRTVLWVLGITIALQLVLIFIYPIIGDDAWIHLNWIEQFPKLFREGNVYPRWLPEGFWGFGSPAFYFYPPLTYWLASIISIFTSFPIAIFRILELIGILVSILTCYWYIRSLSFSKYRSAIGALVYGIFPYRIIDIFIRSSLGEHLSFIFFPLIFLGIEIAFQKEKKSKLFAISISAVAWVGMILINIPMTIISFYSALLYCVFRIRSTHEFTNLIFPAVGALIGAMIASIYFLPAQAYTLSIKLSHLWDFQNIDWSIINLVIGTFEGVRRYFCAGLLLTLLISFWLFTIFIVDRKNRFFVFPVNFFIFCLFIDILLQVPYVFQILSKILPFFRYIQFGFRWNIILVFASAYFVANFRMEKKKTIRIFVLTSCVLTILLSLGYYFSTMKTQWIYHPTLEHMEPPEYLPAAGNDNFIIAMDSLKKHANDPLMLPETDSVHFYLNSVSATKIRFSIAGLKSPTRIIFHRMYFPSWKLHEMNGTEIHLTSDPLGRIIASLPSKSAEYLLSIDEGDEEKIGKIISIVGLILLGITMGLTIFLRNPKAS